ncbi:Lrp/AsnC family transcriptional regulator [Sanyastnella coralliicola]|uniref:Lrp/AsnC family transcriptional regulator n=1 Tax=Sanyastnella coralliicola TaxID=3069118 RepID=UPI0027B897DD|nr:Lrp/AsnC family transcriptional regulator [Longitalea sp. SCSIO 12813]
MKLDNYDLKLIELLQENAKLTVSELAEACGLSRTPVYERMKKLEANGVIKSYNARIDPQTSGLQLHAFCNVSLKEHAHDFLRNFEDEIKEFPQVVAAYHTAGMFDYMIEVRCRNMEAYHDFIASKLAGLGNIGNVQSFFIMKEIKSPGPLDLTSLRTKL